MTLALVRYSLGWLRYMQRGRRCPLLFAPMWGIPLPTAVTPVITLGAAATAVFAIGHVAVSERDRRKITSLVH